MNFIRIRIACTVIVGIASAGQCLPTSAQLAAQIVESKLDQVALNPQPLPPKTKQPAAVGANAKLGQVALNPQPLPPKTKQPVLAAP